MAQIFISHSKQDKDNIHFILEAFAGTKVKPHLEEFENAPPTGITATKIENDIQSSNAIFVLLSKNVELLKHTRDWIVWECGIGKNKDIWLFEPSDQLGKISVVVPHYNHYVLFERTEDWRRYILSLIASYDDSHVLPTLSATTGGGALLNEKDRGAGAAVGFAAGLVGLLLHNMTKPSFGIDVRCWNCSSNYKLHNYGYFRCGVCNAKSFLQPPQDPVYNSSAI